MNDRARDVLVNAAMVGVTQICGQLQAPLGNGRVGYCALGWLWHQLGETEEFADVYGFLPHSAESRAIIKANDYDKWDFLTIARKVGNEDEGGEG